MKPDTIHVLCSPKATVSAAECSKSDITEVLRSSLLTLIPELAPPPARPLPSLAILTY